MLAFSLFKQNVNKRTAKDKSGFDIFNNLWKVMSDKLLYELTCQLIFSTVCSAGHKAIWS